MELPEDVKDVIKRGARFAERMREALTEMELPEDQWLGFVMGWVYGQLRQRFTHDESREVIDTVLATSADAVAAIEQRSDNDTSKMQ